MILSIGNQQYEYINMPLQKLSLQITIFLSDHKNFSPETFAVYDIKNQALQKCYTIRRDLILSTYAKYTYSYYGICLLICTCHTKFADFTEILMKFSIHGKIFVAILFKYR